MNEQIINEDKSFEERNKKIIEAFKENKSLSVFAVLALIFLIIAFLGYAGSSILGLQPIVWLLLSIAFIFSALLCYYKKDKFSVYPLLIWVIWLGSIFIRTANVSQLKDVTTGKYTLAPDLDPYLFLRWAKYIAEHGSLMAVDMMRYVPLGFRTGGEMPLISYGIVYLHKILSLFSTKTSIEYAAVIFPVVFFVLTLIVFFLFVKRLFVKYKNANLIALVSTAFIAVIPGFLHRTIAGVPEKESAGFFFMFLAYYLVLLAWQSNNWKKASVFGFLAGISTGLMGLAWGGVTFVFVTIALAAFVAFFTANFERKHMLSYLLWTAGFTAFLYPFPRFGASLFTSTTSLISYLVSGVFLFYLIIHKTKFMEKEKIKNIKLPEKAKIFLGFILIVIVFLLIFEPSIFLHIAKDIINQLVSSFEGDRLTITVAENNLSYLNTWKGSFGYMFWIILLGAIFLFYEEIKQLKPKQKNLLTFAYIVLILGVLFTKISPSSSMNGKSFLSLFLFIGSMIFFGICFVYVYLKHKEMNLNIELIFIISTFFFAILSSRSAVRLLYFLYPIAPIVVSFAMVRLGEMAFEKKEETMKIILGISALAVLIISAQVFYNFSIASYNEAKYGSVPSYYNIQWQKAMNFVREETPKDSVFAHWWDYGYWVQTMGERATVLDGGNLIAYWDHLMGGRVLTANNETEMLEFLKTHKATHLLIDSSDIGKYTAFSSIGSNENYDKYSWFATFLLDEANGIIEKRNETVYVFRGGTALDEDIKYKNQLFLKENSGVGALMVSVKKGENGTFSIESPKAIIVSSGKQTEADVKCVFYNNQKIIFENNGINSCLFIMPRITQKGMQLIGGALWISPRLMRSEFTKLYLFNEAENFELIRAEPNLIIQEINSNPAYNLHLPEFTIYRSEVFGPIKIWKINYPENIKENPAYLELEYPNEGLWKVKK